MEKGAGSTASFMKRERVTISDSSIVNTLRSEPRHVFMKKDCKRFIPSKLDGR